MINLKFSGMTSRGRGRGRDSASYRGGRSPSTRGGRGSANYSNYYRPGDTLAEIGGKKLIASNISGLSEIDSDELKEFNEWKIIHRKGDTPSTSAITPYINAFKGKGKQEQPYAKNSNERIIMMLNSNDKKWEDNPWLLYDRYIINYGYPMEVYKSQLYYEIILAENGCDFKHYHSSKDQSIKAYSKILINKIISMDEWGLTPYLEKTAVHNNGTLRYNYFDYIQAFNKAFLYQNDQKSHTWFIKLNQEILDDPLPTWVIRWWQFYGTTEEILPELFKDYYDKWCAVIPPTMKNEMIGHTQLRFFIEFSIPYIWKFTPKTGYTPEKIFCLKYESHTRFWDTMLKKDPNTGELNCNYTLQLLEEKIASYKIQYKLEEAKRLQKIIDTPIHELDLENMSREDIIRHHNRYLEKILRTKDIEEEKRSQKSDSDISMTSNSHNNSFDLLQDAQPTEEEEIEIAKLEELANRFIQGSDDPSGKGKGKK